MILSLLSIAIGLIFIYASAYIDSKFQTGDWWFAPTFFVLIGVGLFLFVIGLFSLLGVLAEVKL